MKPEFIVLPSMFAMIGFVAWVLASGAQRRQQWKLMVEFNTRLLDRLGSVKDFNDLLQTEAGARLIGVLAGEGGSMGARDRILRTVQTGVVCIVLGLAFLFLGLDLVIDDEGVFTVLGITVLALGGGLILSSVVSHRVARGLGVLDGDEARRPGR
jgi:hypothetical protein